MCLFLQHDLWSKLIAGSNFKVESPLYFPGSCSQQKGLSPDYNPQRGVSWALLYLFDHIWDSAVQFRPLVKGMCHPNWLHTPLLSVPILPRPILLSMRFKDESSTVALRTLLFCGSISLDMELLKFEFLRKSLQSCDLSSWLLLLISLVVSGCDTRTARNERAAMTRLIWLDSDANRKLIRFDEPTQRCTNKSLKLKAKMYCFGQVED